MFLNDRRAAEFAARTPEQHADDVRFWKARYYTMRNFGNDGKRRESLRLALKHEVARVEKLRAEQERLQAEQEAAKDEEPAPAPQQSVDARMKRAPRQTFTPDGRLVYRTKLLPYDQAQSFALCLRANTARFRDVDCIHSDTAKGARSFFVTFSPATTSALYDAAQREQDKRAHKALTEGRDYLFCLDTESRRPFYRVFNPKSGETYCLTSHECDCPDFQYRLKRASWSGVVCKHIQEMTRRFETGALVPLADVIAGRRADAPNRVPVAISTAA